MRVDADCLKWKENKCSMYRRRQSLRTSVIIYYIGGMIENG